MGKEYLGARIANSNKAQLLAIVYEGFIDNINNIIENNNNDEITKKTIDNSKDILSYLLATLSGNDKIANNYRSLYLYINKLLTDFEIKKDISVLNECIKIITPIYEGWSELGEKIFQEECINNKPRIVTGVTYGKSSLNDYSLNNNKWDKG